MVKLFNDDCMKVQLPKVRMLLTDIPYGEVNRQDNGLRNLDKGSADLVTFEINDFLNHIWDSADIFVIFCGAEQMSSIYSFFASKQKNKKGTVRQLVWCKTNPSPMNGEYIYLSGTENAVWFKKSNTGKMNTKCKKNYFITPTGRSKLHPTEKNHSLLQELILDNSNEGDTILDTCMGSGSTGVVALKNNRKFIGIELDKKYFDIAKERIENE